MLFLYWQVFIMMILRIEYTFLSTLPLMEEALSS